MNRSVRSDGRKSGAGQAGSGKATVRAAHAATRAAADVLARRIYENPELSDQEYRAAGWCRETLDKAGFVLKEVEDLPTAFVAEFTGDAEGPTIGLFAEYDALPGIGHGCGHHLIAGSAVGAGLALAQLRGAFPGRVKVFGCPAEEALTGKPRMIDTGAFDGVDAALTFHAYHSTSVMTSCMGLRTLELAFRGSRATTADPWAGSNSLDGAAMTYQRINSLPASIRAGIRVHRLDTQGGDAFGAVPERSTCHVAVRANTMADLESLSATVMDCAQRAAESSGTTLEVVAGIGSEPIRYDRSLGDVVQASLRELGEVVVDWPALAFTDFGNVSGLIPGVLFSVATWPSDVPFHTRTAQEHSGRPRAFEAMHTGALAMALTAVDLAATGDLGGPAGAAGAAGAAE
ncbi:M20 family metallopeptidase [Actinomadura meridiana]|uniref:Peptidase M20 domain-containing protein 2 n=1 Tax=Actinomadura meridiana TaxID=559626 RepID=A0ABP8CD64_9ACTN